MLTISRWRKRHAPDAPSVGSGNGHPNFEILSDFVRFYVAKSKGKLDDKGRITVLTGVNMLERFFNRYKRVTRFRYSRTFEDDLKAVSERRFNVNVIGLM